MDSTETLESQFVCKQINTLVGAKILNAVVGDEGFPAILVEKGDGDLWWMDVQRDAEGNGPGWINIEQHIGTKSEALVYEGGKE